MTMDDSIQSIERRLGIFCLEKSSNKLEELWPLQQWYLDVYTIPFCEYSDRDLAIAIRQKVYPDLVVPVVINRLASDPQRGFGYDGELLESLSSVNEDFWRSHKHMTERLLSIVLDLTSEEDIDIRDARETLANTLKIALLN